jgi:hypothetical protein
MPKSLRLLLVLSAFLIPTWQMSQAPLLAQERQGCFMLSPNGRLIELDDLCPSPEPFAGSSSSGSGSGVTLGTGDIQVTLRWATIDDLDLEVVDPSGDTVAYYNSRVASGGQLDVDANADCVETNPQPIENIFWPTSQAPSGSYTIRVSLFSRCDSTSGAIPFELTLLTRGDSQTLTGTVDEQNPTATFPFQLN